MTISAVVVGVAALSSWLATPLVARLCARGGMLDRPSARSMHVAEVPRTGGLGLAVGFVAAMLVASGFDRSMIQTFWLPAGLFFALGLADDIWRLRARTKFIGQAALCVLVVFVGWRWAGAAGAPFGALTFGVGTPIMTWLWFMAVITVVNFVDGIDLITSATVVVMLAAGAGAGAGPMHGVAYAALAASLVGMAFWNVSPARVFPGDAATHLLGFVVATLPCTAMDVAQPMPWAWAAAPLLPGVLDVAGGLIAKRQRGVAMSRAHADHLYQRLIKAGSPHVTIALRYGALVACAIVLTAWVAPRFGLLACLTIGGLILGAHRLQGWLRTRALPWSSLDAS